MRRLLDTDQLNELRYVLEDDFPEFIASFIADTGSKLAQLQRLVMQKSVQESRDVAHSLKGSCLNLGAIAMAEQCQRLQLSDNHEESTTQLLQLDAIWAETKTALS